MGGIPVGLGAGGVCVGRGGGGHGGALADGATLLGLGAALVCVAECAEGLLCGVHAAGHCAEGAEDALDLPICGAVILGDGGGDGGAELVDGEEGDEVGEEGVLWMVCDGRHRRTDGAQRGGGGRQRGGGRGRC